MQYREASAFVVAVGRFFRRQTTLPVTTKAQQKAENANGAENAKARIAILLAFLRFQ